MTIFSSEILMQAGGSLLSCIILLGTRKFCSTQRSQGRNALKTTKSRVTARMMRNGHL